MKAIGIPHHDWYFNYFLRWTFVEVWQSSQTHRFFLILKGVLRDVLKSPNAIASFLQWWYTSNSFLLFPHHEEQISYKAHTLHHAWFITISPSMHEFQSFRNLLLIAFVGRATSPSQVAHPSHILKVFNSMQRVQLHNAWCHCSHFYCHPWYVLSIAKLEGFPCLFMFEIQVHFNCLQQRSKSN